jgi:hypothetical protein
MTHRPTATAIDSASWSTLRRIPGTRYSRVHLEQDLWARWLLTQVNGILGLHLGRARSIEINAFDESPFLLILREVKEDFDDAGTVDVQMSLEICDRTISVVPQIFVVMWSVQELFADENIAMHAHD